MGTLSLHLMGLYCPEALTANWLMVFRREAAEETVVQRKSCFLFW